MKRSLRSTLSRSIYAIILAAFFLAPLATATEAHAGAAVWQETDLEYLWGTNFVKNPFESKTAKDNSRSTITIEHADAWKYGDNFFFFDITNPEINRNGSLTSIYGEISPRLSIGKITGKDLSAPYLKDVLLAGTLELGNGFHNYLYGVGFSLNLPKFNFADLNLYVRNDTNKDGVTWQITPCWQLPFTIGNQNLIFEGFSDIAGAEGNSSDPGHYSAFNIDAQPRLLVDLGKMWGSPGNIFVGTEFMYWHNKFGVKGVDEYAPQAMVKWVM
jgi:nucleoside-specific outer membrane channel protein Tsx